MSEGAHASSCWVLRSVGSGETAEFLAALSKVKEESVPENVRDGFSVRAGFSELGTACRTDVTDPCCQSVWRKKNQITKAKT